MPPLRPSETGEPVGATKIAFLLGTFFGMGLMLAILDLWGPGEETDVEHYREVRDLVTTTYVGDVEEADLLEHALEGMLGGLDAYSDYYVSEEVDEIDRDTSGQTIGIGVILRYRDAPQVLFPLSGSPAREAGLRVGDEILAIDGNETAGLESSDLNDLIQGEAGTSVVLRVRGLDGREREHEVERREMPLPSVRRVRLLDDERDVGYIALTSFTNRSVEEFDEAVDRLLADGMRALVLDLRGNQGGVLASAVDIARRFVTEGVLTSTRGRGEPNVERADPEFAWYAELPLVLLVDGSSASASEVLAGALQDHRVAVLVGEPTYGKGVVQTITRYPERRAIAKLTTSYYFTPAERCLQRGTEGHDWGLLPELSVEIDQDARLEVYRYLHGTFEPPQEALPALEAWEQESGEELIVEPPADEQLDAALAIFAGELFREVR